MIDEASSVFEIGETADLEAEAKFDIEEWAKIANVDLPDNLPDFIKIDKLK